MSNTKTASVRQLRQHVRNSVAWSALSAAALAALSSHAHADGLVISGLVTAGTSFTSNVRGDKRYGVDSGPYRPAFIGFSGTESLGGGTSTYFRLNGRFFTDSGQPLGGFFNTYSVLGLRGAFGDLSMGLTRDFMFEYYTLGGFSGSAHGGIWGGSQGPFDNFGGVYGGAPGGSFNYDRANGESLSNSIKYTHKLGDLKMGAMYSMGERSDLPHNPNSYSAGALYESGRFAATAVITDFKFSSAATNYTHIRSLAAGTKWGMGSWTLAGGYTRTENLNTSGTINTYGLGLTKTFGSQYELTTHYQYMKGNAELLNRHAHQVLLRVATHLSKRSRIYAQAAYQIAGGQGAKAWINGSAGPSDNGRQAIAGVFLEHAF